MALRNELMSQVREICDDIGVDCLHCRLVGNQAASEFDEQMSHLRQACHVARLFGLCG